MHKRADIGELQDLFKLLVDLMLGEAQYVAVEIDVVDAGEFGIETRA